MRHGGMPDYGRWTAASLIRQSETLQQFAGRGARAPASVCLRAALGALFIAIGAFASGAAHAEDRALKLYNNHTKERATIVFKRNGKYDRAGLAKINQFLRDWRRNEPTKMDPQLLDLVWEAYRKTGSNEYIHVVSAYRSPATNGALRSRSKGVAKNSQHTRGKAIDFFIPGVPLAELRAIGLRAQVGGVGYYPTSGSPFVHMDTGSVRHWPRMSRQQLVKVFPKGKTLHVPSDGKPLPGYSFALAAHKSRSSGTTAIASFDEDVPTPRRSKRAVGDPIVIASVSDVSDDFDSDNTESEAVVVIAPPVPRPSPLPAYAQQAPVIVASAEPVVQPAQAPYVPQFAYASVDSGMTAPSRPRPFQFESPVHWSSPSVPADLARAMAERDVSRPASLPIRPTAVVATIDVSRPLRAEAMTRAVLQKENDTIRDVSPVFAYASTMAVPAPVAPAPAEPRLTPAAAAFGTPVPVPNPFRTAVAAPLPLAATGSIARAAPVPRLHTEDLTLTALDTLGLRLWIASQSTRQKQYALLTMPDFSQVPSLMKKPTLAYSAGFGNTAYQGLRTDSFSGPLVRLPTLVDLSGRAHLAFR